jgi:hypothetical protein
MQNEVPVQSFDLVKRATIRHRLCTNKQSALLRICALTIFGSVVSLAPMSARAQAAPSVPAEIAALQAQVAALQSTLATLQTSNSALQTQVNTLQSQLNAVLSSKVYKLNDYVDVDFNSEYGVNPPNIVFSGANIHIVSGQGITNDTSTGLGNLIIGYDEDPSVFGLPPLSAGDRGGSHNLVIGMGNRFRRQTATQTAYGGLVAGELNTISNVGASVTGGSYNTASYLASVTGGTYNTASGPSATVLGGSYNTASGLWASVTGGAHNTVSGGAATVLGGPNNTDTIDNSIRPQPPFTP